jgi:RNA polymerase sigma-70 factor, ECF subfamily
MIAVAMTPDRTRQLEALYREDGGRLWRAILAYSGDPEIASDAVAEAYAQVMRRGEAVRDPRSWVWKASFRIAAGELKARPSSSVIPDTGYSDPAVDQRLLDALAELPEKQRAAVILFYYVDASVRDIAQRTRTSQLAVRANLSRGRKRLKQILGDSDD